MAKEKYQLTSDLVKIEPEPVSDRHKESKKESANQRKNSAESVERITINLDKDLKYKLQIYAINNKTNMTDIIHEALRTKLGIT